METNLLPQKYIYSNKKMHLSTTLVKTLIYGIASTKYQSVQIRNFIVNTFPRERVYLKKEIACKRFFTNYLLQNY